MTAGRYADILRCVSFDTSLAIVQPDFIVFDESRLASPSGLGSFVCARLSALVVPSRPQLEALHM
jgi:hypothetical protein